MTETCNGPECSRQAIIKGYCNGHYQQVHHGRPLKPLQKRRRNTGTCPVKYCEREVASRGVCARHASVCGRHRMDPDEYVRLSANGCMNPECLEAYPLQVDHDHSCCPGPNSCGACIRGLLCGSCNVALANLEAGRGRYAGLLEYLGAGSGIVKEFENIYRV